jgi:hypothetical protein
MKPIYVLTGLLMATLFIACTTDITLNLKGTSPELVVEGAITTDTMAHTIILKKTSNYFSNQPAEAISGAAVALSDGVNSISLVESGLKKGYYQTPANYFGVVGRTYTLTIDNVDVNGDGVMEQYTASCPMSTLIRIDSIEVLKERLFRNDMWAIKAWLQDPAAETDYYLLRDYKNNISVSDSIQEWGISNDEFFNGKYLLGETMMYLTSEKKDEIVKQGDLITLELCAVTKDYMGYIREAQEEFFGRNPLFGGQPANIRTNIKQLLPANGKANPHGYFAAYPVSRAKTVYNGL